MTPRILFLVLTLTAAGCAEDNPVHWPMPVAQGSPFRYPVDLWDQGLQGETVLLVHVTDAGVVDSAVVDRSSGFVAFDSAAVSGAYNLRFSPARRGAKRFATWARLPVRFAREDAS